MRAAASSSRSSRVHITVAAKEGGGDIEGNPSLALAVQKAKDASMPKDNIERAIASAAPVRAPTRRAIEAVLYEGYGPGGVAVLVEALTDNRNRTGRRRAPRSSAKHGGNLGEPGSVAYLFDKKGVIVVDAIGVLRGRSDGRDRRRRRGHRRRRRRARGRSPSRPTSTAVRAALEAAGIAFESAEVTFRPSTRVEIDEPTTAKLLRLIDTLEDSDDVGDVHANFEADAEVLERVAAGSHTRGRARRAPEVLREEPRYRLLFAGQVLSVIGDRITFIALPFAVLAIGDLGDLGARHGRRSRCRSSSSRSRRDGRRSRRSPSDDARRRRGAGGRPGGRWRRFCSAGRRRSGCWPSSPGCSASARRSSARRWWA